MKEKEKLLCGMRAEVKTKVIFVIKLTSTYVNFCTLLVPPGNAAKVIE